MSDIKYIIAGDDREHTGFPCLAVVRYAAATVVTVLALAVIAMVIHAVLRSEDIRLSVNDGFIGADNLWSQTSFRSASTSNIDPSLAAEQGTSPAQRPADTASSSSVAVRRPSQTPDSLGLPLHVGVGKAHVPHAHVPQTRNTNHMPRTQQTTAISGERERDRPYATSSSSALNSDNGLGVNVGDDDNVPSVGTNYGNNGATNVTLQRAKTTNLRVTLIANNPGGRTKIDCNQTNVTLIVMNRYAIGTLQLSNFTVPPQTTITLQKRLKITDPTTLRFIWSNYGGQISFSVTVRVSARVTSYPLGKKTQTKTQTYVCRLVTVGLTDYETYLAADDDTECRAVPTGTPAWAPAPAPAPAP